MRAAVVVGRVARQPVRTFGRSITSKRGRLAGLLLGMLLGLLAAASCQATVVSASRPPVLPVATLESGLRDAVCREVMIESFGNLLGSAIGERDDVQQDERLAQTVAMAMLIKLFEQTSAEPMPSLQAEARSAPYLAAGRFVESHAACADVGIGMLGRLDAERSAQTRADAGDEVGQALRFIIERMRDDNPMKPRLLRAAERLPAVLDVIR